MLRVELMGPPGVGKTTIYKAAVAARNRVFPEFAICEKLRRRASADGVWSEFGRFVDQAYAGIVGGYIHQRRLAITHGALSRARRIEAAVGDDAVVIDQGLCQRGLSLWLSCGGGEVAEAYFHLMPAPAAVFRFIADPETVRNRNIDRGRCGGADRSEDADACRVGGCVAASVLGQRGVPVVDIDADRPVDDNVRRILDAMRDLSVISRIC